MAEGLCRYLLGNQLQAFSAGIECHELNPNAVKVMAEIGIDISDHHSKTTDQIGVDEFDYVLTVCDNARESCPYFSAITSVIHHGFDDPPNLAEFAKTEEEALQHYRRVRDEIKSYLLRLFEELSL
jgi:arsenate reductase